MGPAPRGLGMIHGNSPGVMIRFTIMSWHPSSTRSGGRIWESSCILVQRVGRKTGERMGYFLTAPNSKPAFFTVVWFFICQEVFWKLRFIITYTFEESS